MLWQTHIRIANDVLSDLRISKSSPEAAKLRDGVLKPDKWADYPHHYGKSGAIQRYLLEARAAYLQGDLSETCLCLGIALHYIQDSYTSLTSRSSKRHSWEQQTEQSYFSNDLRKLVASTFANKPGLRQMYLQIDRVLSENVEGMQETLGAATITGRAPPDVWGKPFVDLNFARKASIVVARSVFSSKRCLQLEEDLSTTLTRHKQFLKETEHLAAEKLVELVRKRDKSRTRGTSSKTIPSRFSGLLSAISCSITGLRIRLNARACNKQSHLKKIAKRYRKVTREMVAPHVGWYNFTIPEIDLSLVDKELLTVDEATQYFKAYQTVIEEYARAGQLAIYEVQERSFIKRAELVRILKDTRTNRRVGRQSLG